MVVLFLTMSYTLTIVHIHKGIGSSESDSDCCSYRYHQYPKTLRQIYIEEVNICIKHQFNFYSELYMFQVLNGCMTWHQANDARHKSSTSLETSISALLRHNHSHKEDWIAI